MNLKIYLILIYISFLYLNLVSTENNSTSRLEPDNRHGFNPETYFLAFQQKLSNHLKKIDLFDIPNKIANISKMSNKEMNRNLIKRSISNFKSVYPENRFKNSNNRIENQNESFYNLNNNNYSISKLSKYIKSMKNDNLPKQQFYPYQQQTNYYSQQNLLKQNCLYPNQNCRLANLMTTDFPSYNFKLRDSNPFNPLNLTKKSNFTSIKPFTNFLKSANLNKDYLLNNYNHKNLYSNDQNQQPINPSNQFNLHPMSSLNNHLQSNTPQINNLMEPYAQNIGHNLWNICKQLFNEVNELEPKTYQNVHYPNSNPLENIYPFNN